MYIYIWGLFSSLPIGPISIILSFFVSILHLWLLHLSLPPSFSYLLLNLFFVSNSSFFSFFYLPTSPIFCSFPISLPSLSFPSLPLPLSLFFPPTQPPQSPLSPPPSPATTPDLPLFCRPFSASRGPRKDKLEFSMPSLLDVFSLWSGRESQSNVLNISNF